jgi:hypothetical protein
MTTERALDIYRSVVDERPPKDIVEAVEGLLDTVLRHHATEQETFYECRVCGEWEGHEAGCFVAVVQRWQRP